MIRPALLALALLAAVPALAQRAPQGEDDEAALLVTEGRSALARKKYDRAASALDRALAVNPRRLDAYLLRAGVHAALREDDKAVALLRRARDLAPESLEVLAALGSELTVAGSVDEGVKLLEVVAARDPTSYQAQATLGRHYASEGRWRPAAVSLRAYLAARPAALAGEDGSFKTALAEALLRGGDPAGARDLFDQLAAADPRNTKARLGGAWAAAAIDCQTALPRLQGLDTLAEKVNDIWLVAGRCRLQLGQLAEARDLADRWLALHPDGGAGHLLRGEAILAAGNPFEARRELDAAVRLDPRNHRVLVRWARATRESGAPAEAVKRLREAEAPRVEDDEPEWTTELGEGLSALGQPAESVALLKPLVEHFPENRPARTALGAALLASGDAVAAMAHLELGAQGGEGRARALLGEALTAAGTAELAADQAPAAEKHLARAVEVGAGEAALVNLGVARLLLDDVKGALGPLERAARAPKSSLALIAYGRALAAAGRTSEAILTLEAALPGTTDPARAVDLALELAAAEAEGPEPARALARLDAALARAPAGQRARLQEALVPAARAAATRLMAQGNFAGATKVLERAERAAGSRGETAVAVRCDLALAATAAGEREVARARLRQLEGARCPFAAPADEVAVSILAAVNTRPDDARVDAAVEKLAALAARTRGPAARLAADAARWLAARAAAASLARNRPDKARRTLAVAARLPGASPELAYDAAAMDLEAGRTSEARAALEAVSDSVPEALVALGLAAEREGDPRRALELYRKAASRGVKSADLDDWIAGKQRLLGEVP